MLDKIVRTLGADVVHYQTLLKTEKTVVKRAREGKRDFYKLSLGLICCSCALASALLAMLNLLLRLDVFTYALVGLTYTMLMVVLFGLQDFDILLSPTDYPVVAHTPVSSRTYFLVKLTQLLRSKVALIASLTLIPAIGGIWTVERQLLFPLVYLPVAFLAGFFMIGVMTAFTGYLTKLYTRARFRQIAQYAQMVFAMLFPVLWLFTALLPRDVATLSQMAEGLKAFYALPNSWFAGAVALALGNTAQPFLVLTGLAVLSTFLLLTIPLRQIAKSYAAYLAALVESSGAQKSQMKVKTSLLEHLCQSRLTLAGFGVASAYVRRDKYILQNLFGQLGGILLFILILAWDDSGFGDTKWIRESYAIGLSPGFSLISYFLGSCLLAVLAALRRSEHWKAAWVFQNAPIAASRNLWRGMQITALFYISIPCAAFFTIAATILWHGWGIFYALPTLIALLYYILFFPAPPSGLPLAEEYIPGRAQHWVWIPLLCGHASMGAVIGLQFLTYKLHTGLYISFYCALVVAGILGLRQLFKQTG